MFFLSVILKYFLADIGCSWPSYNKLFNLGTYPVQEQDLQCRGHTDAKGPVNNWGYKPDFNASLDLSVRPISCPTANQPLLDLQKLKCSSSWLLLTCKAIISVHRSNFLLDKTEPCSKWDLNLQVICIESTCCISQASNRTRPWLVGLIILHK